MSLNTEHLVRCIRTLEVQSIDTTAHDYGEAFAEETLVLLPDFILDARALEVALRTRLGHAEA
jgi:hypothetical protein